MIDERLKKLQGKSMQEMMDEVNEEAKRIQAKYPDVNFKDMSWEEVYEFFKLHPEDK